MSASLKKKLLIHKSVAHPKQEINSCPKTFLRRLYWIAYRSELLKVIGRLVSGRSDSIGSVFTFNLVSIGPILTETACTLGRGRNLKRVFRQMQSKVVSRPVQRLRSCLHVKDTFLYRKICSLGKLLRCADLTPFHHSL